MYVNGQDYHITAIIANERRSVTLGSWSKLLAH